MTANLAVTDLLVGAVSMPFSTGVDAFILRGTASHSTIFVLNEIGISVLITLFSTSYHLLLLSLGKVGGDSEMDRVQSFNPKRTLKKVYCNCLDGQRHKSGLISSIGFRGSSS